MTTTIEINDVTRIARYVATAAQTIFTVPFAFYAVGDLKVYRNSTLLTYNASPSDNTEYSVTGAGNTAGGTIVLGTGGADASDNVTIISDLPVERVTDFPISGPFQIEQLNEELDKLTIMISQNETKLEKRALVLPDFDDPTDINDLPTKAERASKVLGFDADGQPVASDGTLSGGVPQLAAVTPTGDQLFYFNNVNEGALVDFTQFAADFIDALSNLSDPGVDSVLIWDDSADTWVFQSISSLLTAASRPTTRTFTGTTDTLVLGDAGNRVQGTNGSAITITVPPQSSVAWVEGDLIEVKQSGAGQITFAGGAGVTLESFGNILNTAGQNATAVLRYEGSNVWQLGGELEGAAGGASEASAAEIWTGTETEKYISPDKLFDSAAPQTLTSSSNATAVNMGAGINFDLSLDEATEISNPTNAKAGQSGRIQVTDDGTGGFALTWAANWNFIGGTAPTITSTASSIYEFAYFVNSSTDITVAYLGTADNPTQYMTIALSDLTTELTTGTDLAYWDAPFAGTLTDIIGTVLTAPTGSGIVIDVHLNGTTIMTTDKLDIDATTTSTEDAATAPALTTTAFSKGDRFTFDLDAVGSTTGGNGAQVTLVFKAS